MEVEGRKYPSNFHLSPLKVLAVFTLSEFFKGLFSVVGSILRQCFGVGILDYKAGYVSMDCGEP